MIQQYLEGKLTPGEMHQLEKQALEDPFLADALEGYGKSGVLPGPQLSLLQRQLDARISVQLENKNRFYFSWQRLSIAAAAGLMFVTAGILFWMKPGMPPQRHSKNSVEVTLDPGLAKAYKSAPGASGEHSPPPPSSAEKAASVLKIKKPVVGVEDVERAAQPFTPLAEVYPSVLPRDTTGSSSDDIPTMKENAKNDFQDFVGGYQQNRTDLILEPNTLKDGEVIDNKTPVAAEKEPEPARLSNAGEYAVYLKNKLLTFASSGNFTGTIRLEFIPVNGKVTDLKIKGSPGKAMDEEIRKAVDNSPLLVFRLKDGSKPKVQKIKLEFKNVAKRERQVP